jgi:hypothetical protein
MMPRLPFQMRPAPVNDPAVKASWTIHCDDQFATQIGTRLERRERDWRMVFKDDKSVTVESERDAMILIQGILLGGCLC